MTFNKSRQTFAKTLQIVLLATVAIGNACSESQPTQPATAAVRHVVVTPASQTIQIGGIGQVAATASDSAFGDIGGLTFDWSSNNTAVASVDSKGKVTAIAIGDATITASVAGVSSTAAVKVIPVALRNFAVVGAQFTQGVQSADGSIPMVLLNKSAVVNVLISKTAGATTVPMQVVLNMFDVSNRRIRSDTANVPAQLLQSPTFATPTVQFLVPAADMQPGVRWNVIRDPKHVATDEDASDDAYPRTGTVALGTAIVQPFNLRFLPIRLDANGGGLSGLSLDQLPEYTRTLVSAFPLGVTTFTIGQPVVTSTSFGTAPNGGELAFWQAVLDNVDFARSLSVTDQNSYWMGVVVPPAAFRNSTYAGIGYLPSNGNANGDRTRSSVAIGPDWYASSARARENVAHEIGHNFGRSHAPCGDIGANVDTRYPTTDGKIGVSGHDVFAWSHGLASAAPVVDAEFADVMSYCSPAWTSPYTYLGILNFRNPAITSIVSPLPRQRVLFVRGSVADGVDVKLEPAFTAVAYPSHPELAGGYHLQGLSADGNELFSSYFAPALIDHAPTIGHFTFAIPLSDSLESQLATLRITAPNGKSVTRNASPTFASALAAGANGTSFAFSLHRASTSTLSVSCRDATTAGIVVQNSATSDLLGVSTSRSISVDVAVGTPITILCSDGVRTIRSEALAK